MASRSSSAPTVAAFSWTGELERLVDAEGAFYASNAEAPRGGHGDSGHYEERPRDREYGGKRRREGFLGELFG